jgi:hypothetical protein
MTIVGATAQRVPFKAVVRENRISHPRDTEVTAAPDEILGAIFAAVRAPLSSGWNLFAGSSGYRVSDVETLEERPYGGHGAAAWRRVPTLRRPAQ